MTEEFNDSLRSSRLYLRTSVTDRIRVPFRKVPTFPTCERAQCWSWKQAASMCDPERMYSLLFASSVVFKSNPQHTGVLSDLCLLEKTAVRFLRSAWALGRLQVHAEVPARSAANSKSKGCAAQEASFFFLVVAVFQCASLASLRAARR